ncbi:MAG TPA: hypothetical protein VMV46_10205 [Thermoanaerobaculia bacterium]|nr:hypothetical protein [Thermoanaerobaculia bacterium]
MPRDWYGVSMPQPGGSGVGRSLTVYPVSCGAADPEPRFGADEAAIEAEREEEAMKQGVTCGVVAVVILVCSALHTSSYAGSQDRRFRAQPGESVRIVRFNVKSDQRAAFEQFFWQSLKPAAKILDPDAADPAGDFRLLIPRSPNRSGHYTYYVIVDPIRGALSSGETMRDMVRRAFPGKDGEERVERWMRSIALGELAPEGEQFSEADLDAEGPPALPR